MRQLTQRVYPAIRHLRLDKITGRHIQQFASDLITNGKNQRTGKPLSRKTVIHHLTFISDVFNYAVKMNMLSDNPCRRVTVLKGEVKEKDIYTIEEIAHIFELLDGEDVPIKFRVFFKLAVYTDTPKTKKSQRSLKFPQCVMDMLREYKAEQDEECEKLGSKWQDYSSYAGQQCIKNLWPLKISE